MKTPMPSRESAWGRLRGGILPFRAEQWYRGMVRYRLANCLHGAPPPRSLAALDDLGCIFIHIPKNGGISVSQALFGDRLVPGHRGLQFYRAVYGRRLGNFFTFAVVRNPWDRLVSAYHFLKGGGLNELDARRAEQLLAPFETLDSFVCGWLTPRHAMRILHLVPQYQFICDFRGNLAVDCVAHLETIDRDFSRITARLGLESRTLPRKNTSARRQDYREYYSPRSRDIVARVYAKDIAMFGYRFDP